MTFREKKIINLNYYIIKKGTLRVCNIFSRNFIGRVYFTSCQPATVNTQEFSCQTKSIWIKWFESQWNIMKSAKKCNLGSRTVCPKRLKSMFWRKNYPLEIIMHPLVHTFFPYLEHCVKDRLWLNSTDHP